MEFCDSYALLSVFEKAVCMQWSPCNTCVSTDTSLGFISHLVGCLGSRRGTLNNGLYGRAPPERGTFFRLQVYRRVGILLVEVYERVQKSVI